MTLVDIIKNLISGLSNSEVSPLEIVIHCGTKYTRH